MDWIYSDAPEMERFDRSMTSELVYSKESCVPKVRTGGIQLIYHSLTTIRSSRIFSTLHLSNYIKPMIEHTQISNVPSSYTVYLFTCHHVDWIVSNNNPVD